MRCALMAVSTAIVALAACSDPVSNAGPTPQPAADSRLERARSSGVTVLWNQTARHLVVSNKSNAFQALRGYAVLSAE